MTAPELPSFQDFMDFLEQVLAEDITEETRDRCPGCWETFGEPNDEGVVEPLVRFTRCGHIMGRECFREWFVRRNRNTCPFCRAELFHQRGGILNNAATPMTLERLDVETRTFLRERFVVISGDDIIHLSRVMANRELGLWPATPEFEEMHVLVGTFAITRWLGRHHGRGVQLADLEQLLMLAVARCFQPEIMNSVTSGWEAWEAIEDTHPGVGHVMLLLIHTIMAFAGLGLDSNTLVSLA